MVHKPPIIVLPWWHPDAFIKKNAALASRQKVLRHLRRFFEDRGFTEVETPSLQVSPGLEVHLHAFKTELRGPRRDDPVLTRYLHTSPEFTMKKLLVAGLPKIWQLAHVYRNNEGSDTHHPEFMMLEWYRTQASYHDLMQDCVELIRTVAQAADRTTMRFRDVTCDVLRDWQVLTVPAAFERFADIDLMRTIPDGITPSRDLLAREAQRIGIRIDQGDSWDDLFFRIMFEKIESVLGKEQPTFLTDYPVSMAALARPKPEDPRLAERFELYICGLELANAFGELTDAAEQRRRFEADMAMKQALYGERYPIDEDFLAALRFGMPSAAGIALGFDRLVMLCAGVETIDEILWAPVS